MAASSASASTTACSRPIRSAVAASKISPVANQRRASRVPIAAMTYGEITAGSRPSLLSVRPNFASGTPMAMSQQATRPTPPPKAAPCTRAIVGLGSSSRVRIRRARARASSRFSASLADAMPRIQFKSAPAENDAPLPSSTTTRTSGS